MITKKHKTWSPAYCTLKLQSWAATASHFNWIVGNRRIQWLLNQVDNEHTYRIGFFIHQIIDTLKHNLSESCPIDVPHFVFCAQQLYLANQIYYANQNLFLYDVCQSKDFNIIRFTKQRRRKKLQWFFFVFFKHLMYDGFRWFWNHN